VTAIILFLQLVASRNAAKQREIRRAGRIMGRLWFLCDTPPVVGKKPHLPGGCGRNAAETAWIKPSG